MLLKRKATFAAHSGELFVLLGGQEYRLVKTVDKPIRIKKEWDRVTGNGEKEQEETKDHRKDGEHSRKAGRKPNRII